MQTLLCKTKPGRIEVALPFIIKATVLPTLEPELTVVLICIVMLAAPVIRVLPHGVLTHVK